MTTFHDIVTDDFLLKAINDLGFTEPTSIQAETIPLGLAGKDIIGQAKTGSGKTFAFGIPIMHALSPDRVVQALIVCPTRELCQQVSQEMKKLAKYNKTRITEVYGGVGINPQIDALRTAQIVAGTPGRLLDHLERRTLDLTNVTTLVLDEADRMLDMGFIEDIEEIMKQMPNRNQTLLFSATMPKAIKNIAVQYMNKPEHVKTSSHVDDEYLPQFYYVIDRTMKFSLLYHLIKTEKPDKGLIFCATRRTSDAVAKNLTRQNVNAQALHGGLSQARRTQILKSFNTGRTHLLIATDVAARGLHIDAITHVFNYDVPKESENYVHRIGRTARAGESGKAITLLEQRDFDFFQGVLNIIHVEPTELDTPDIKRIGFRRSESPRDGFRGNRGGPRRGPPRGGPRRGGPRGGFGGSGPNTRDQRKARKMRRQKSR